MYFHVLKLIKPQNPARLPDFGKYLGLIDQFLVKTAPGASNAYKTEFWKQLRYIRSQVLHILLSWFLVCRHFGGVKNFVCWEISKKLIFRVKNSYVRFKNGWKRDFEPHIGYFWHEKSTFWKFLNIQIFLLPQSVYIPKISSIGYVELEIWCT